MSQGSLGLLVNWPKAAVEEGLAFANPGSCHCIHTGRADWHKDCQGFKAILR